LLKLFTASKQKRYLTRHFLIYFMVSPACPISVHKVKQPNESMATEEIETFLYMSDRPPTAFHRWPNLKVELKKRILAYLLDAEITHPNIPEVNWRTGPVISNNNVLPFLETQNSELATLAQEVYPNVNVFFLFVNFEDRSKLIEYPNPDHGQLQHIHHIFIRAEPCNVPKSSFDTLFREKDTWRFMLRYRDGYQDDMRLDEDDGPNSEQEKRGSVRQPDTDWQKHFPNLRELTVYFILHDVHDLRKKGYCCYGPQILERIERLLERMEMDFKADTVNLVFDVTHGCKHVDHDRLLDGLAARSTR
jgi:hypothetical protein